MDLYCCHIVFNLVIVSENCYFKVLKYARWINDPANYKIYLYEIKENAPNKFKGVCKENNTLENGAGSLRYDTQTFTMTILDKYTQNQQEQ